jgi:hypothetical protein
MSVLDAIGDTPLIRLTRVTTGLAAEVHLKAEFLNPAAASRTGPRSPWSAPPRLPARCCRAG